MSKQAFFEIEGWEEESIRRAFPDDEIFFSKDELSPSSLPEARDFEFISVFVNSEVTKEVIAAFPELKCITTRSTGFDHIDKEAAKEKGISVLYVPGYGDNTVAEFAFGLMLSLTRRIYEGVDRIKETGSFSLNGLRGIDIKGKTLGVVGTGRIGKEMIKIAKGFGMEVLAHDPFPDTAFASQISFEYASLEDLLGRSDIVSLHCPYNEKTHHILNQGNISSIKKGAYVINTARGPLIETSALVKALQDGIVAGAGLDVLEEEGETKDELKMLSHGHPNEAELKTVLENHFLMKMPNVLITPHNAFNSVEALQRILNTTLENITAFKGGSPKNIVS